MAENLAAEYPRVPAEGCVQCHSPHRPPEGPVSPELCSACHGLEDEDFLSSHGKETGQACVECHTPRGSAEKR